MSKKKADKLGVPFLPFTEVSPNGPIEDQSEEEARKRRDEQMEQIMNKVVSVCECGKEIKRADDGEACGNQRCPFGYWTN